MAITHDTPLRADLAEAVKAFVETGSGTSVVRIKDSGSNVLISFDLPDPAYTSDSAGAITLLGVPIYATALLGGTCSSFDVLNRDGDLAYSGSVGVQGSGADLEVTNLSVLAGQKCALTAHAYRAPV